MADKLIIDWKQYNLIVEKLAVQIYKSGFKPDMLIGIMRGGAPIIDVLSRVFKLKCAYLAVESYSGEGTEDQQGELVFSREMSSTVQEMKGNLLLCDDLSDTGVTLNKSIDWLRKYPPLQGNIKDIKQQCFGRKKTQRLNLIIVHKNLIVILGSCSLLRIMKR
jgi:hypoxanthine phosphoribosyltransferase